MDGGILGCLTALQCARRGLDVVLVEREPVLWSRASLANEGKIHLGLVYAAGAAATRRSMLRDALGFAPGVEEALGESVDWPSITSPAFSYIVMPDSALAPAALAQVYREVDDDYASLGRPAYLGERLESVVDPHPATDEASGLPSFRTAERAVDPIALRALVVEAIERTPGVSMLTGTAAAAVDSSPACATTVVHGPLGTSILRSAVVVDCRWESQGAGIAGLRTRARNLRVKAAVRARTHTPVITATLVAGPFGDVVQHRDYAYLSWYPAARVHREFSAEPSGAATEALRSVTSDAVVRAQLSALGEHGWVPDDLEVIEGVGGFIVGDGQSDIDDPRSPLHDRAGSGVRRHDRILLPQSLKFTSAPSTASAAAAAAHEIVRGR